MENYEIWVISNGITFVSPFRLISLSVKKILEERKIRPRDKLAHTGIINDGIPRLYA
jgi:hypothetical protein